MSSKKRQAKMAQEELVKTQVLNIEELRNVARYEKKISKKPAAICAFLGAIMLLIGAGSQGYISYSKLLKENKAMQKDIAERKNTGNKQEETIKENERIMLCQKQTSDEKTLTKTEASFAFYFDEEYKLKKEYKVFTVQKISGYMNDDKNMTTLYNAYKDFENLSTNIPGYLLSTVLVKNIGFQAVSKIDFTELNISTLPAGIQNNPNVKADFSLDIEASHIKERAESLGYTCTMNEK